MCLWAFDTGGTTRHRVPKLFTHLRMDQRLGELWEAFQNPVRHTGNRRSDRRTLMMAALSKFT